MPEPEATDYDCLPSTGSTDQLKVLYLFPGLPERAKLPNELCQVSICGTEAQKRLDRLYDLCSRILLLTFPFAAPHLPKHLDLIKSSNGSKSLHE